MLYSLLLTVHIVSIVAWMAGMLYLPRIFVYWIEAQDLTVRHTLTTMAHRLRVVIMMPSMVAVWASGILLMLETSSIGEGWLHVKFVGVIGLTGLQIYWRRIHARLVAAAPQTSDTAVLSRRMRRLNELPFIILIIIVFLVIFKPF